MIWRVDVSQSRRAPRLGHRSKASMHMDVAHLDRDSVELIKAAKRSTLCNAGQEGRHESGVQCLSAIEHDRLRTHGLAKLLHA